MLTAEVDGKAIEHECYGEELMVRVANPEGENGEQQEPGPLTWLNSARVVADPDEDAVHCLVSVGDPRGAFCFTIRRRPDTGTLIIHMPHPGEGMPHMATKQLQPGTLEVGHYDPSKPDNYGGPANFKGDEPETEDGKSDS